MNLKKIQQPTRGNKAWQVRDDSIQSHLVRASARSDRFPLVNPPRPHAMCVMGNLMNSLIL